MERLIPSAMAFVLEVEWVNLIFICAMLNYAANIELICWKEKRKYVF